MDILSTLNKKQKEAVLNIKGPLLVLAGPGSGKTKTLTHRIAHLIEQGAHPSNILAVTFTNKAADEMKGRIAQLLQNNGRYEPATKEPAPNTAPRLPMPAVGTFHAICVRILRVHAAKLGYGSKFSIYDDADQLSLMKRVLKELSIDKKELAPQKALAVISGAKNRLITPAELETNTASRGEDKLKRVCETYQNMLREANGMDFDDLLLNTVLLFENNPEILNRYQKKYKHILVDEYQDTNLAQNTWLRLLAAKSDSLCVVGDDAQSIYSWRSADVGHILNFEKSWPKTKVIKLEQNYRSTQTIVEAAAHLISNNKKGYKKELWTQNKEGEKLVAKEVATEHDEAEFVVEEMGRLNKEKGLSLKDFVVLYRTNAQSRAIEEAFLRYNLPYKIVGGLKFYQRAEVKDVIAFLRLLQNPGDIPSRQRLERLKLAEMKKRLPKKAATKKQAVDIILELLQDKQKESVSLPSVTRYIIDKANFEGLLRDKTDKGEERWYNVQELLSVTQDYAKEPLGEALPRFLEDVTLAQEADNVRRDENVVHLMTLHMAKGLEFPVVFMAGCEEGLLPHSSSMMDQAELEEERRLMYVGITRAKEKAYLLFARRRMQYGTVSANPPSSFLDEIPEKYIDLQSLEEDDVEYLIDDEILWD